MSKISEFTKIYKKIKQSEKIEKNAEFKRQRHEEYARQRQIQQEEAINEIANNQNSGNNDETAPNNSQVVFKNNLELEKKDIKLNNPIKVILTIKIILVGTFFFAFIMLFIVINSYLFNGTSSTSGAMAISGYYTMDCQEVTVIFTDKQNGYEVTGTGTYPLEEYVAGVVAGEVAYLGSIEVDKEFAIAARSYFITHNDNCTIESSDRKQVFRELTNYQTDQMARQAAEETKGQVLLKDNQVYGTEYDAFCSIAVDDNYYTISQANQKIPRSWVDNEHRIAAEWKQGNCAGNHGRGLSQFGSLYLANEQGYTYDGLLAFYLGNEITISSGSGFMSSIPGLEIKDTRSAKNLNTSLSQFLSTNGTSVEEMNAFIKNNVKENGAGTREGVVTAAVSLINYLYAMDVSIPYYWGGQYQTVGVNPSFGGICSPSTSRGGNVYNYCGLDCSGFVSWAIRNGGYTLERHTTLGFHNDFSSDSCDITRSDCIGQPGDLINSKSCHVQMIVSVDEASGKYYVAQASGTGVIMNEANMHEGNCSTGTTLILHMDNYYNNQANVDQNY